MFSYQFDYDEWPAQNANIDKQLAPYNGSIFKLRYMYPYIYKKIYNQDHKIETKILAGKLDPNDHKVFKIKYKANILPMVCEDNGRLTNAIAESEELAIFQTELVKDLIDYKWQVFALRQHTIGLVFHLTYVLALLYYINITFLT